MADDDYEEHTYFTGTCTCPPECENYDPEEGEGAREYHGWGDCGGALPNGSTCPCQAGWEE